MKKRLLIAFILSLVLVLSCTVAAFASVGDASFQANLQRYPALWDAEEGKTQPVFQATADGTVNEVVWVEVPVDTDNDNKRDLIQVRISRPKESNVPGVKVPVFMEFSPYRNDSGTTYRYTTDVKHDQQVNPATTGSYDTVKSNKLRPAAWPWSSAANEELGIPAARTSASYGQPEAINYWTPSYQYRYFIPRGYAVVYASSIGDVWGGIENEGLTNCGGIEETLAATAVIQWLNGNAKAYTNKTDNIEVFASDWCNGNVAMSGASYNGTIPIAVASTGVEGLKAIIPVAAISSWYDYYRDNGAVIAPGGYQGEDADELAWYCLGRYNGGKWSAALEELYRAKMTQMGIDQDRITGDYNSFWDERNYLASIDSFKAAILVQHGLNDWNVKTKNFDQLFRALKDKDPNYPIKMQISLGGHGGFFSQDGGAIFNDLHLWLDHYLYGIDNGAVEKVPTLRIADSKEGEWQTYDSWPIPSASYKKYYLSPKAADQAGELALSAPSASTVTFKDDKAHYGNSVNTSANLNNWERDLVNAANIDAPSSVRVAYVTEPLIRDVTLSGTPKVTLNVAVDKGVGSITVALVELGEARRSYGSTAAGSIPGHNGLSNYNLIKYKLNDAISDYKVVTRASVDVQNPNPSGQLYMDAKDQAYVPNYSFQTQAITPGEVNTYTFHLEPMHYTFQEGMRVAVLVYSSDYRYTILPENPTEFTLHLGQGSYIDLPLTAGLMDPPTDLASGTVEIDCADYEYVGDPAEPTDFAVTFNGTALEKGKHYVIDSYANNEAFGTATINIRGIGAYTGTASGTFEIIEAAPKAYLNAPIEVFIGPGSTTGREISYVISVADVADAKGLQVLAEFDADYLEYIDYEVKDVTVGFADGSYEDGVLDLIIGFDDDFRAKEAKPLLVVNFVLKDGVEDEGDLHEQGEAFIQGLLKSMTLTVTDNYKTKVALLNKAEAETRISNNQIKYDANGDDTFDLSDVLMVYREYLLHTPQSGIWPEIGHFDINGDAIIDLVDVLIMISWLRQ